MAESPCSVPDFLRAVLPLETLRQQLACRRHDDRYERGGDRLARLLADLAFGLDLLGCSPTLIELVLKSVGDEGAMGADLAEQYVWGVRMYGGGHWRNGDDAGTLPPRPPDAVESP